uniref:ribosomal protein S3 n=1 Tax=Euplotes cristatus TaxID=756077 RepID=UPI002E776E9D|nr:ribosomal protein S3 [Euplotes cristatus]UPM52062.1 ribosomal protein S3 [Euplotes cristatus]
MQTTRRALLKARFSFWSRFRQWSLRALSVRRNHWPLLISRIPLGSSSRAAFLARIKPYQNPPTPEYLYPNPVSLVLVWGLLMPFSVTCFSPLPTNLKSIFFISFFSAATNQPISTTGLVCRNAVTRPSRPEVTKQTAYSYGDFFFFHPGTADVAKQQYIFQPSSVLGRSPLYILLLSYRRRERLFSRAFIVLRYRLFVWRGVQLRVLSLNRRLRRLHGHHPVQTQFFSWPSFRQLRRTGYAVRHNPDMLNLFFWWYRVLYLGSRATYIAGLRLLSLVTSLPWYSLFSEGISGPVFFLYSLLASRRRRSFSYLSVGFARTLLRVLLFQKSSLFLSSQRTPTAQLRVDYGVNKLRVLGTPRCTGRVVYRRPLTNLFFSFRSRRRGSCFIRLRGGFLAWRLSIPRVLPWRARFLYLHHRVRWFWLRNPTTQVTRHEVYTLRRQHWLRGRRLTPNLITNRRTFPKVDVIFPVECRTRVGTSLTAWGVAYHKLPYLLTLWRTFLLRGRAPIKKYNLFRPLTGRYVGSYFSNYINRFFEYFLGTRVTASVNFELIARITLVEFFMTESIKSRLRPADSLFSTIFFVNEFIDLVFLALRAKNFNHLITYLNRLLKSLVIWDHKRFLVFFFSAFREQFLPYFGNTNITGLHLIVRGKIGVGGNSRRRSMSLRLGVTSRTHTFINVHTLNTWLNTSTGSLGFRVFLYYTNG